MINIVLWLFLTTTIACDLELILDTSVIIPCNTTIYLDVEQQIDISKLKECY